MSLSTIASSVKRGVWQMWRRPSEWLAMTLSMAILLGSLALGGSVWRALVGDVERFPDASRLVVFAGAPMVSGALRPDVARLTSLDGFSAMSAFLPGEATVESAGSSFELRTALVADRFFHVLGAAAVEGTLPDLAMSGVVVSESAARRLFPAGRAVGQSLRIGDTSQPVIAVVGAGYEYPREADLWIPFGMADRAVMGEAIVFLALGRLRPGVTIPQAQQAVTTGLQRESHPPTVEPIDAARKRLGAPVARASVVATVSLAVLAIAALALLLVVQTSDRLTEFRIRLMLGASRRMLGTERFTETLVPLLCAALGAYAITQLAAVRIGSSSEVAFDVLKRVEVSGWMFLLGTAVALVVVAACAAPIVLGTTALAQRLRESRTSKLVVCLQMGLAVLLGVLAMALHRSVQVIERQDHGFATQGVMTARVALPIEAFPTGAARTAAWESLIAALQREPGVRAVGAVSRLPFEQYTFALFGCAPVGREYRGPSCTMRVASPDYFAALGTPLLSGRAFSSADTLPAEPVCVVNRTMATQMFGEVSSAVGAMVRVIERTCRVVGVVGDVHERGTHVYPTAYLPFAQLPGSRLSLAIAGADPERVAASVREQLRGLDRAITVPVVQPLSLLVRRHFAKERLMASVIASLAAIGLTLAFISMYALMTRFLTSRVREIAIRQAIGATTANMLRWAAWVVGVPALIGIVSGAVASSLGQRALSRLVYGLTGFAAADVAWVVLTIAAGITVAVCRPMWQALRASPATVLRHD